MLQRVWKKPHHLAAALSTLLLAFSAQAGKLSIVIDDVGYRLHNENQVLQMPLPVTVAILPNAPHSHEMAVKAHNQGREILIHMPMAPLSKQPLERDTLHPDMSSAEVSRIIRQAVANVPYAVGMNNHMGSAMTSSLPAMQNVMQALNSYHLFFLDSMTIGNSQATRAAAGTSVKVIKRRVFLDDVQNEAEIRRQFERAVQLARRNGSAIAIGHPHPSTIRVLQQMLPALPGDVVLVRPSDLLNEPSSAGSAGHPQAAPPPKAPKPAPAPAPRNPFRGVKMCKAKQPPQPVYADAMLAAIGESVLTSPGVQFIERQWQQWQALKLVPDAPASPASPASPAGQPATPAQP